MQTQFRRRERCFSNNSPKRFLVKTVFESVSEGFLTYSLGWDVGFDCISSLSLPICGWSGGAMVLGKLSVPGRPTNLDYCRARADCACSRCGWGLFGHFFLIYNFSLLSPSLWQTARYRLKYCLKGPLSHKQPTNQPIIANLFTFQSKNQDQHCSLTGISMQNTMKVKTFTKRP